MRSRSPSSDSLTLKVSLSLPPGYPGNLDVSKASDVESPLIEERGPSSKPLCPADLADLSILLCSVLFIATSITLITLVFLGIGGTSFPVPYEILSTLQRVVATFSASITAAVIMVIGKQYVLSKLVKEGLRSRRIAVYSSPSIMNLASYLVLHGVELPLLGLSAVWGLALATSLTVNDIWGMGSTSGQMVAPVLSGPLDPATPGSSYLPAASEQLGIVMSSLCLGVAGTFGLMNITDANLATDHPTGVIYYPPPPQWAVNIGFSYPTTMNGFNVSMERLSSVPSTAQNLTCKSNYFLDDSELWFDGSNNQTLSIVTVDSPSHSSILRFNATAIIMGGTLSSTSNYTEFRSNGTSWPNVMAMDDQWALDITNLICNVTCPTRGDCESLSSLFDFASMQNLQPFNMDGPDLYTVWSSVLNMALGAYSAAVLPSGLGNEDLDMVPVTMYNRVLTPRYGIYILIANTVVSAIMLVIALRLRLASHLSPDFIDSTRLLLNPLKRPELFNATLVETVEALGDPSVLVKEDSLFLLMEQRPKKEGSYGTESSNLRRLRPFSRTLW